MLEAVGDGKRHLKIVASPRYIRCPYQENRQIPASVCFIGQRTPTHELCFRCPDGSLFEEKLGARTFNLEIRPESAPDSGYIAIRVKSSKKKHGTEYTYAHYKDGVLTRPFYEAVISGTFLSGKEHHGPLPDKQLIELAAAAARNRLLSRRGEKVVQTTLARGRKKMIGNEMASLIADRKKRSTAGWYTDLKEKHKQGTPVTPIRPGIKSTTVKHGAFAGVKKKAEPMPESAGTMINKEAKRLFRKKGS